MTEYCPHCHEPLKLHRRHASKWYRLLICPSGCKGFEGGRYVRLISKNKIDYSCGKFEECCVENMANMKCGGCEK